MTEFEGERPEERLISEIVEHVSGVFFPKYKNPSEQAMQTKTCPSRFTLAIGVSDGTVTISASPSREKIFNKASSGGLAVAIANDLPSLAKESDER